MPSKLEAQFADQWGRLYPSLPFLREVTIPPWEAWASERKALGLAKVRRAFVGDFVWEQAKVVCELQGAIWVKGGHSTGGGIQRDAIKQVTAAAGGWVVLPLTAEMIGPQGGIWLPKVAAVIQQRMGSYSKGPGEPEPLPAPSPAARRRP
jgi:very-short-patch-repair endonuclease